MTYVFATIKTFLEINRFMKIGKSDDTKNRKTNCQTGNHMPIICIAKFDGGLKREYIIKKELTKNGFSSGGGTEWFIMTKKSLSLLQQIIIKTTHIKD